MSQPRNRSKSLGFVAGPVAVLVCALSAAAESPSLELVQTIPLKGKSGKLDHLIVDSKGDRLFQANKVNNTLDIVDLKAGKLVKQITGQGGIQGLAYAADLDRLYAALGTGGYCNIFNGKDYKLLKTVKFMNDADNVRYNPRTHTVYVAHAEKGLGVIDGESFDLKIDISLPGPAEAFQLETGRPRLYVNVPSLSQVLVIDTDKNEIANRYPLKLAGGNYALALDEASHRLLVGCRKKPMLVVMDADTGNEITSLPIPADTDDVFYDAKRKKVYAACGEGSLAVIRQNDADHYEMLEKLATIKDARTCFFDPNTGRLYLAVPRQPGKEGPEIQVYQARP